jgi:23S rRNA (adenine1618-N6)-methyltransferase
MSSNNRKRPREFKHDFELLASKYPDFCREWRSLNQTTGPLSSKATPEFQLALTRAILDFHFRLKMPSLPAGRLCPPVPNRWFYCEWVLLELMPSLMNPLYFEIPYITKNYGLDIGTGASAIFPLLLVSQQANLHMLASEVDTVSIESAAINVEANKLKDRVTFIPIKSTGSMAGPLLQALDHTDVASLDFVVTNPPFYDERPPERADGRDRAPMSDAEGLYPGGEVGWVLDMLRDSLSTLTRIGWYSTMLCKKSSFQTLERILTKFLGPGHVRSTELDVGSMTRWFLAWTYHKVHGKSPAARATAIEFQFTIEEADDPVAEVAERIKVYCEKIPKWDLICSKALHEDWIQLTVTEKVPHGVECFMVEGQEVLPSRARGCLNDLSTLRSADWLPTAGHFLVDFSVAKATSANSAIISVTAYRHSNRGGTAIDKILSRLEGEVSRSNRRWRRLRAKSHKS